MRLTFTTQEEIEETLATLETTNENEERANFLKYDDIRKVNSTLFDHTHAPGVAATTQYAMRLSGTPQETYGLARSIAVMPGDVISAEVFAKYVDLSQPDVTTALEDFIGAIVAGSTAPGTIIDGGGYGSPGTGTIPYGNLLNKTSEGPGAPKAYLNWIVFDKNFVPLASKSGFDRISTSARENGSLAPEGIAHEQLLTPTIQITEPGYVYIYLSNEEPGTEVYFDDFKVTHTKSPVLEENFYYPFGMIAQRNSREGMTEQSYLYNGKELQDELDLGWFDYGARMYQPEIARWNGVDASSENYVNQSPYHYAGNNPVIFVDYDGNDYGVSVNHSAKTITIQAHFLVSGANKAAFDRRGSGAWNSQSGKNVFVAGGLKALRNGNANTYKININVTSEVVEGAQSGRGSDRDKQAVADKSGTVNSFDSSEKGFEPNQNGGTVNRKVDVKEGKVDSGTTTHEVSHALGNGHTDHPNGTLGVNSGESVGTSQVAETLAGVGIGGNNIQRNATGDNRAASIGDGTMLNNSTNSGLESGKVITENRYNRIIRRIERREERQNR